MLSLADSNNQRTSLTRRNNRIGMIFIKQHNHVSARHTFKCNAEGFFEAALIIFLYIFDEIEQHFRIRITFKMVTLFCKLCFKLCIILNDSVMDHGQFSISAKMGMCIPVAGLTMCGPSGMADTCVGVQVFSNYTFFKGSHAALFFIYT